MPKANTNRVAFPLRRGTDEELGRWKGHPSLRKNLRFPTVPAPELCVTHGAPATWSKEFRLVSRVDREHYRRSRRSRILHDLIFSWERINRAVERPWKGFSTSVTAQGCRECRRWLRHRRLRSVALFVAVPGLFFAVPRALLGTAYESAIPYSVLASLFILVLAVSSLYWIHKLAKAFVSDDGTRLVIRDAHPDYVREALALGAEPLPEPCATV